MGIYIRELGTKTTKNADLTDKSKRQNAINEFVRMFNLDSKKSGNRNVLSIVLDELVCM